MKTRTENSIRNVTFALGGQALFVVMSFICRTVFIHTLGQTYLGFNGLFSDIFNLLSLAEMGVGTAILYAMYTPAAQADWPRLAALLELYRRMYWTIGSIILLLGAGLIPFLDYFISNIQRVPELKIIYLLYLFNTYGSYFFAYKKSILTVYQNDYIASTVYMVRTFVQNILQIFSLLVWHNFIIYLVIQAICTLSENIFNSFYVDHHYPQLKQFADVRLPRAEKWQIFSNIKAMFISRLSYAVVSSTDNLMISAFVSTLLLGVYTNYILIVTMIRTFSNSIFRALTGSIGNLIAEQKDGQHVYQVIKRIWFINFWLTAFTATTAFILVNPFIRLWIGHAYLLPMPTVFLIFFNMYMYLMRSTFWRFNDAFGHFNQLQPKAIAEMVINLFFSLIFVLTFHWGLNGVLLGTLGSNLLTNFWYEPYLVYQRIKVPFRHYLTHVGKYLIVLAGSGTGTYFCCQYLIGGTNWLSFITKGVVCCLMINLVIVGVYYRTEEFSYARHLLLRTLRKGIALWKNYL